MPSFITDEDLDKRLQDSDITFDLDLSNSSNAYVSALIPAQLEKVFKKLTTFPFAKKINLNLSYNQLSATDMRALMRFVVNGLFSQLILNPCKIKVSNNEIPDGLTEDAIKSVVNLNGLLDANIKIEYINTRPKNAIAAETVSDVAVAVKHELTDDSDNTVKRVGLVVPPAKPKVKELVSARVENPAQVEFVNRIGSEELLKYHALWPLEVRKSGERCRYDIQDLIARIKNNEFSNDSLYLAGAVKREGLVELCNMLEENPGVYIRQLYIGYNGFDSLAFSDLVRFCTLAANKIGELVFNGSVTHCFSEESMFKFFVLTLADKQLAVRIILPVDFEKYISDLPLDKKTRIQVFKDYRRTGDDAVKTSERFIKAALDNYSPFYRSLDVLFTTGEHADSALLISADDIHADLKTKVDRVRREKALNGQTFNDPSSKKNLASGKLTFVISRESSSEIERRKRDQFQDLTSKLSELKKEQKKAKDDGKDTESLDAKIKILAEKLKRKDATVLYAEPQYNYSKITVTIDLDQIANGPECSEEDDEFTIDAEPMLDRFPQNVMRRRANGEMAIIGKESFNAVATHQTYDQWSGCQAKLPSVWPRKFHHSEQNLVQSLSASMLMEALAKEDRIKYPAEHLSKHILYGVVLDIYSERYPCHECRLSITGLQNPDPDYKDSFLKQLENHAVEVSGMTLCDTRVRLDSDAKARMITRISSAEPCTATQKQDALMGHQVCLFKKSVDNRMILQRDVSPLTWPLKPASRVADVAESSRVSMMRFGKE